MVAKAHPFHTRFWTLLFFITPSILLLGGAPVRAAPPPMPNFERIPLAGVVQIAAGSSHTCAVISGGSVRCWGNNESGQLGDGTYDHRPTAVAVVDLSGGVTAIAAGHYRTCAVTNNGSVLCWGITPVAVAGLSSITAIAVGDFHTCAVTSGGGVLCWGSNFSGQLGDGTRKDRATPVAVAGLSSDVTAIAAGDNHTCAVTSSNAVHCWGSNSSGQLGDGTQEDRLTPGAVAGLSSGVTAIAAGSSHTCAVTNGGIHCWGSNSSGQLGDGTRSDRSTPVAVAELSSGVFAIAAGYLHTCAVTGAPSGPGGVHCWGYNEFGQLGDGTGSQHSIPVAVTGLSSGVTVVTAGGFHTCAATGAPSGLGGVQCWGRNLYGQVGDGTGIQHVTPVVVTGLSSSVTAIAAARYHTCALISSGVYCWGDNFEGQLGDGTRGNHSTPMTVAGLSSSVSAIAAGGGAAGGHTCAVTISGGVQCWGDNYYNQLGDGTREDRTTPVAVIGLSSSVTTIAAGYVHTCAVTISGGVQCWGANGSGQLGDGTREDRSAPVAVAGMSSHVTAITAGGGHTCTLISSGGVQCWGSNFSGQLGDGTTISRTVPVTVAGLNNGVTAIAAGEGHTCAIISSGGVRCWGSNDSGQLGDGTGSDRLTPGVVVGLSSGVTAIAAGGYHTCAVISGGVQCWGRNGDGQLGDGTREGRSTPVTVVGLNSGVTAIVAGGGHTCAVTSSGGIQCWGYNSSGQLGDGSAWRTTPVDVLSESLSQSYLPVVSR